MYKKRSLATAENADALSSTPETTSSTASNNIVPQDNDIVKEHFLEILLQQKLPRPKIVSFR